MSMRRRLKRDFFDRKTLEVAEDLVGKYLIREVVGTDGKKKKLQLLITETEAYIGEKDLASHARFGKTKRNEIMYGPAGFWYVYLIYGLHYLLNVITEPKEQPAAVLIRAGILETGKEKPVGKVRGLVHLNGPAKITKALQIGPYFNKRDATKGQLYFEDRGYKVKRIQKKPRVGIDYAKEYAKKPWRFILGE